MISNVSLSIDGSKLVLQDSVNPQHYRNSRSGVQCIDVTRWMGFNLGNAIKYLWRQGQKDPAVQDLRKAVWYIQDEIARLTDNLASSPAYAPKVVCLCGSTKFKSVFMEQATRLTLEGYIVLMPHSFAHHDFNQPPEQALGEEAKARLDQLHLRKIDLADEVLVINHKGYIGNSTRHEIDYAHQTNKVVTYLYPCVDDGTTPSTPPVDPVTLTYRVGQRWRARNGDLYKIVVIDRDSPYPVVVDVPAKEESRSFTLNGKVEDDRDAPWDMVTLVEDVA